MLKTKLLSENSLFDKLPPRNDVAKLKRYYNCLNIVIVVLYC